MISIRTFVAVVAVLTLFCGFGSEARAERPKLFARGLAASGSLGHDAGRLRGRENAFTTSNPWFPRMQARAAWRQSEGHAANLPMVGLRVARVGGNTVVIGRRR